MDIKKILQKTEYFYKLAQVSDDGTDLANTTNLFYNTFLQYCDDERLKASVSQDLGTIISSNADDITKLRCMGNVYSVCLEHDEATAKKLRPIMLDANSSLKEKREANSALAQSVQWVAKAKEFALKLNMFKYENDQSFLAKYDGMSNQANKIIDSLNNLRSFISNMKYKTPKHEAAIEALSNASANLFNESSEVTKKKYTLDSDELYSEVKTPNDSLADEIYS